MSGVGTVGADAVVSAADRLVDAARRRVPCAPVRELIGADAGAAYTVAQRVVAVRVGAGARVVGRKIGLTSAAVQRQLGVDRPDFGILLDDMDVGGGAAVPVAGLLQPRVEAEIAFVLADDLDSDVLDAARVRAAVGAVAPALEVVDSRILDWDITFADTVADNGSSALFVLGPARSAVDDVDLVGARMEMRVDGTVLSTGTGADCLGDPMAALVWLARTAHELGDPLRSGQIVLSGALGPMTPVHAGMHVTATISGVGDVEARFVDRAEEHT